MKVYKEKYVAYAYRKILGDLLNNPEYISIPRGMEVREIINSASFKGQGYFDMKNTSEHYESFVKGLPVNTRSIWKYINLEL